MRKTAAVLVAFLFAALASEAAFANGRHHHRHGRAHFGVHIGIPLAAPLYYYPYGYHYYYPPPVYVAPAAPQPQVWIEREQPDASPANAWWYFCPDSRAYYPYVRQCPGGWQRVAPQPAPG